jgi:hypothetical protein
MKVLLLSALLLTGCATADYAQMADIGTTAIGLESGFVEGNPVWGGANWPVMAVVKIGVTQAVKLTPPEVCEPGLFWLTIAGSGAAIWNVGVIAGSGPAAIPVAIGLWWWQWDNWQADAVMDCQKPFFLEDAK